MNNVKGKVILVTGGGQGLGAAICKTMAEDGAKVIAVDVNENKLQNVVKEITDAGGNIKSYSMNVADEKNVQDVINEIIKDYGKIDVVINNAGIDYTKSIEEITYDEWNKVVSVNLTGPFNVSKSVYPFMKKNGSGHIVNITSTAAKRAWPNASAYHASKWGLLGFSHALHSEARKDNIKVTALVSGGMQTPFILERFPEVDPNVLQDPKNVAETIKYVLCQPAETVIPEVMVLPMRETSWP
ncbi:MAG TPA: SDR family oxidoreductase [Hanamia sp.]|nr:SDR family oxidoreductase [Hanamia sp.]